MPTLDPPPTDRINHCFFCGAVVPEHRAQDGKRTAGRPREYCAPEAPGQRSACAVVGQAIKNLEEHLPQVLRGMKQEARTRLRKQLWALANSVPQSGFNSPEWQARAKKAQAEKRAKKPAPPPEAAGA